MPNAQETFIFPQLPQNAAELSATPEAALTSPYQAAALTVAALCRYGESPQDCIAMLNVLKGPQPLSPYEIQFLRDRLSGKAYLPFSFFAGASPVNGYSPSQPYTVTILSDPYSFAEEGYAKLLVQSAGADQARPVKLRRKGASNWFLWEQFLLSGIREPAADDPWA